MDNLQKILRDFADRVRFDIPLFSGEKTEKLIKKETLRVIKKIEKVKEKK